MAKSETNQRKREEIKAIMAALFERGWTALMLAAYTGHTTSCISAWKLGKSMGTNAERAELAALPAPDAPEVRSHLVAQVVVAEKQLAKAEEYRTRLLTKEFAEHCESARRHAASWAEHCRRSLAALPLTRDTFSQRCEDVDSKKHFEMDLAKYSAIASDPKVCEASVRADIDRWSKISGARQALKDAKAAVEAQKQLVVK